MQHSLPLINSLLLHLHCLSSSNILSAVKMITSKMRIISCTFFVIRHHSVNTSGSKGSTVVKGANLRTNVITNIAKQFNAITLENFPLTKTEQVDLVSNEKIEKACHRCQIEQLDKNPNYYPSISTILNATMPPDSLAALKRWETEKIKQLGWDGFNKYKKELFTRGRVLHQNLQIYLQTRNESDLRFHSKHQENMWKSIESLMPEIGTLYASELSVHHPVLKYRGILDCVATYHDIPTIFEWKTSEKIKPTLASTYDNPLQAVAYYSCVKYSTNQALPDVQQIILVIAYEDGTKANVHLLEPSYCRTVWKKYLKRLEQFWSQMATT